MAKLDTSQMASLSVQPLGENIGDITNIFWNRSAVADYLAQEGANVTSDIIKDLITSNDANQRRQKKLYNEYRGKTKINEKKAVHEGEPNNKLPNDFRGDIIDQKSGYSYGNAITYSVTGEKYSDEELENFNTRLMEFSKINHLSYLDTETGKFQGICGSTSRLLYLEDTPDKNVKMMHIPPWECIYIYDRSIDEVTHAMRYYHVTEVTGAGDTKEEKYYVEWYDNKNVTFFIETDGMQFKLDPEEPAKAHGFDYVPLIEFPNKTERLGDFEKVRHLIDAYDYIISFGQDELEAFRNAYLMFKGVTVDDEFIQALREEGAMEIPEGADAEWLIKNINDAFVQNHLNTLKDNIYRFSKSVDMTDENFSGASQSGESRKWKLKSLADDAILKEKAFEGASLKMFRALLSNWQIVSQVKFDYWDVDLKFTNNIPRDLQYEADTTSKLRGNVSEKTRLGLLSFVEDPEAEMRQMEKEQTEPLFDEGNED